MHVNASSFRAAALVKAQKDVSSTSLEFVQISAGGKDVLEDLLERLAKVQALNRKLRSSRIDEDTRRMLADKRNSASWGSAMQRAWSASEPTKKMRLLFQTPRLNLRKKTSARGLS